jgi:cholera toxin transcriptional activator
MVPTLPHPTPQSNARNLMHASCNPHSPSPCNSDTYRKLSPTKILAIPPRSNTLDTSMPTPQPARRYRFGVFEADASTGELRRQGIRVKLNAQPFQILTMLLDRPGDLLTREQIAAELWPDGTFVDYEHGVNSAINRIREALGDTAGNPRFVETLARRGYRFIAPVERMTLDQDPPPPTPNAATPTPDSTEPTEAPDPAPPLLGNILSTPILSTPDELPKTSYPIVQTLFVLFQLMYLGFYIGALSNLPEIQDILSTLPRPTLAFIILIVTAAVLIPVRAFVIAMVTFHAPGARKKFLQLWPFLLLADELWSLAPFLLIHHINFGLALSCTALLVYSPFAQRSLILMGAGRKTETASATFR